MTTNYEEIRYEIAEGVATLTINRPEQLNALTDLTQAEIRHALAQSEILPEVVGTVLTGEGRGFCSGVDMNALGGMSEAASSWTWTRSRTARTSTRTTAARARAPASRRTTP